jgi:hypothetical protein
LGARITRLRQERWRDDKTGSEKNGYNDAGDLHGNTPGDGVNVPSKLTRLALEL